MREDIIRFGKKSSAGHHSAHLTALIGKIVGIYNEAKDKPLNQALIKMMSRDDPISMKEAYGKKNFQLNVIDELRTLGCISGTLMDVTTCCYKSSFYLFIDFNRSQKFLCHSFQCICGPCKEPINSSTINN